jgi:hypothetical protein
MPTTTVIWKYQADKTEDDEIPIRNRRFAFAEQLAGPEYKVHKTENRAEDGTNTVIRDWPDMTSAEAWVEFVLTEGALFAAATPD